MLSFTGARWTLLHPDEERVHRLVKALSLPPVLARCLVARGQAEPDAALSFLHPSEAAFHDPFLMKGMDAATARIETALCGRERVRIVTDYDVDGTTSSLILQATLQARGAGSNLDWHIPDRFTEGYGFSRAVAARAVADGVQLLITADVGVRDHEAVDCATRGGVDVIVCDHHLPEGSTVPGSASAVLCPPQAGCPYPNRSLAACGVSFKLAQALLQKHPRRDDLLRSLLKLAALGTVADVVSLATPENRAIVHLGLKALSEGPNAPGLAALLAVAGCEGRPLSTSDVGFRLGPRINAAGRIEHARAAVELLLERDPSRAQDRARDLDELNGARQHLQEALVTRILQQVDAQTSPVPLFPVFHGPEDEGWHRGVVGIVASKVRERLHRPVAVASVQRGVATGSIRSIPEVHAVRALESAADLLLRFGGHPAAAGFAVPVERLSELEARLSAWVARTTTEEDLAPCHSADLLLAPGTFNLDLVRTLRRLEPLGQGNPAPRVLVTGVRAGSARTAKDRHLFFQAAGTSLTGVWWGGARWKEALERGPVDLLGTLEEDDRNGWPCPRVVLEDARTAQDPGA